MFEVIVKLLLKIFGIKQQAIVNISEHELSVIDINSGKVEVRARVSKDLESIIGNFNEVEKELKPLMATVFPKLWFYNEVIVCLIARNQKGYTDNELQTARDLAFAVGAHIVYVSEFPVSNNQAARVFKGENIEHELINA